MSCVRRALQLCRLRTNDGTHLAKPVDWLFFTLPCQESDGNDPQSHQLKRSQQAKHNNVHANQTFKVSLPMSLSKESNLLQLTNYYFNITVID